VAGASAAARHDPPSFIPPRHLRDLRDFTRRRKQVIGAASQERNRVRKVLEDANVKIGDVLTDLFGLSGQLMLEALVEGQATAADIAQLAQRGARKKIADLEAALEGHQMRPAHRMLIRHAMEHMAFLAREIESLDKEIEGLIRESELSRAYELLQTIPGIRETSAATILAESGPNMKQFPKPGNFSSWSGGAPGNNESAGVRKRAPAMKENPHIKAGLVEAGWSASRTKETEFQERYERIKGRLGHKRAIVAAGHMLALSIYEVLSTEQPYQPKRARFKPREIRRLQHHHARRLKYFNRWLKE
jgi:transposase